MGGRLLLPAQQEPDAMDVHGHHRKRHGAGKAARVSGPDAIESSVTQIANCRFHRREGPAYADRRMASLPFPVGLAWIPLLRQPVVIKHPACPYLVLGVAPHTRSKLTARRSGRRAKAAATIGTA